MNHGTSLYLPTFPSSYLAYSRLLDVTPYGICDVSAPVIPWMKGN
jgi:hypothetical protein